MTKKLVFCVFLCILFGSLITLTKQNIATGRNANAQVSDDSWDTEDDFVPFEGELNEEFDCNLFKELTSVTPGNLLVSPLSVKLLLTMIYEGSTGITREELREVLQLSDSAQATREHAKRILDSLKTESRNYVMKFGSRMYLRSDIHPRRRFAAIIERFYQTELVPLYNTKEFPASEAINGWVSNVTHGRIKDIATQDDVEKAALLLINALYFKGAWYTEFPKNQTNTDLFYVTPEKTSSVEYMSRKGRYFYLNSFDLKAKTVRIPYKGRKFSMFVMVPHKKDGLPQLLDKLNPKSLRNILWLMGELEVNVTIPKFKFDATSQLTNALKNMGLQNLFSQNASLLGIALGEKEAEKLVVSNVLQKAGLEVNEQGSTASAATELVLIDKIDVGDIKVTADHPFVFFIQDETTGAILFMGKVEDPTSTNSETQQAQK